MPVDQVCSIHVGEFVVGNDVIVKFHNNKISTGKEGELTIPASDGSTKATKYKISKTI